MLATSPEATVEPSRTFVYAALAFDEITQRLIQVLVFRRVPQHPRILAQRPIFKTKKRQPPVPLPDQLLAHLRRWKRRGQQFAVEWNGNPVQSVDKAFANVVTDAGLGDDVTPHVLRHTAATWLMQAGTDVWEAAGYLGMTIEMLSHRYGHHHPDHLSGAKRAFTRHRKIRESVA